MLDIQQSKSQHVDGAQNERLIGIEDDARCVQNSFDAEAISIKNEVKIGIPSQFQYIGSLLDRSHYREEWRERGGLASLSQSHYQSFQFALSLFILEMYFHFSLSVIFVCSHIMSVKFR